jgi:branched-subunit amino acid ABC-type transport system permease component
MATRAPAGSRARANSARGSVSESLGVNRPKMYLWPWLKTSTDDAVAAMLGTSCFSVTALTALVAPEPNGEKM